MKKVLFFILLLLSPCLIYASVWQYDENHFMYGDDNTHLMFMLNTKTKEAMLGDGINEEHNAQYYPPIGHPDFFKNFWENVVVPSTITYGNVVYTVTSVAPNAFYKSADVKSIVLPETIKQIGGSAFSTCPNLESVNIPEGVPTIGTYTFYMCRKLKKIKLPSTITSIGNQAFIDCVALEEINIPGNCTSIGNDAFSWCISLNKLIIEDGETPLRLGYAYEFGPAWQPNMEPYIRYEGRFGRGLFNDCPFAELYLGRSVEFDNIWGITSPFEHCDAYYDYLNNDKAVYVHTGRYYKKLEFGDQVKEIPAQLFRNAQIENTIVLPKNLKRIHNEAFYQALRQHCIIIPESCDSIGENAFFSHEQEYRLNDITCLSQTPPNININSFSFFQGGGKIVVTIPNGTRKLYTENPVWRNYTLCDLADEQVEVNVKYANSLYGRLSLLDLEPQQVFRLKLSGNLGPDDYEVLGQMTNLYDLDLSELSCEDISPIKKVITHLLSFKFPKNLKTIGEGMFKNSLIKGVLEIPASCNVIGYQAFMYAPISKVILNGNSVAQHAFDNCNELTSIIALDNAYISKYSFYNLPSIETVYIGDKVYLDTDAFYLCSGLHNICFDGNDIKMRNNAFGSCNNIKDITVNGTFKGFESEYTSFGTNIRLDNLYINNISGWAKLSFKTYEHNLIALAQHVFLNKTQDSIVTIPEDVTTIGDYAFYGCNSLRGVYIKGVDVIGKSSFANCINLEFINLSDSIKNISTSAFKGCKSLAKLNIPHNVKLLEESVFEDCSSLQNISIPSTVTKIRKHTFANCSTLKSIDLPVACQSIGIGAFKACTAIENLSLPYLLSEIADSAFVGCTNLNQINALWRNPPAIPSSAFTGINKKCILKVPVNTVPTYYEKGWGRVPLIEEGICVLEITSNGKSSIYSDESNNVTLNGCIPLEIGSTRTINILPNENYYIKELILDNDRINTGVNNTSFTLTNTTTNHLLNVISEKYVLGDVNNDDYIDIGDISDVVDYIKEEVPDFFIKRAADTNQDDRIDVGDIRGIVNLIYDYNDTRRLTKRRNNAKNASSSFSIDCNIEYSPEKKSDATLSFNVKAKENFVGFQTEIVVPEGWYVPCDSGGQYKIDVNDDYKEEMNIVSVSRKKNGNYLLICTSSMIDKEFDRFADDLFTVQLRKDDLTKVEDLCNILYLQELTISYPEAKVATQNISIDITQDSDNTTAIPSGQYEKENNKKKVLYGRKVIISNRDKNYDLSGKRLDIKL